MGNYAKASDDFRKVLQLKPNDADAKSRLKYAEQKYTQQKLLQQLPTPPPSKAPKKTKTKAGTQQSASPTPSPAR
jgi:hypothetical protein